MQKLDVLFLGLCSRAQLQENRHSWNVIGLSSVIYTHILPSKLAPFLVFAVNTQSLQEQISLEVLDDNNLKIGYIKIQGEFRSESPSDQDLQNNNASSWLLALEEWMPVFLPTASVDFMVQKPGHYSIVQLKGGDKVCVGGFSVVPVTAPDLTPDRIKAIKSDPKASKFIRMELACRKCESKFRTYFGLERSKSMESEGWIWSPDIKEQEFQCNCGATKIDVSYINSGLSSLLGQARSDQTLDIIPYYERSALQQLRRKFFSLLDSSPPEETIQKFIEANPLLLHMFSAVRIIPKPSIGTKFKADFAILDSRGDLVLIELERADIKLMKKNGHRAQELVHAIDQVGDWLIKFDEHRVSVLDDLNIESQQVHNVRGAVIAGREAGYDAAHMRSLKMRKMII